MSHLVRPGHEPVAVGRGPDHRNRSETDAEESAAQQWGTKDLAHWTHLRCRGGLISSPQPPNRLRHSDQDPEAEQRRNPGGDERPAPRIDAHFHGVAEDAHEYLSDIGR